MASKWIVILLDHSYILSKSYPVAKLLTSRIIQVGSIVYLCWRTCLWLHSSWKLKKKTWHHDYHDFIIFPPKKSPRTRSFWSLPSKPSPKPPHPVDASTTHLRTSNEPKHENGVGSHRADLQLRYPCNLPHVKGSNICLFVFSSLGILLALVWMPLWMLVSINTWKTWRTYN